ncbi:hypothetical protein [Aliidiomarina minuta]|uniref:hypothetical protein n=1 Tax=Aliidiomarina minuta TaxID=880057 RepID=UPI00130053FB|nr:hypothetical protein [Aliidiomarina minuta]
MKRTGSLNLKRAPRIIPNERRRQLWRRHRLRLIERRAKWFHQAIAPGAETKDSDSEE